jgi:hypothetical protein
MKHTPLIVSIFISLLAISNSEQALSLQPSNPTLKNAIAVGSHLNNINKIINNPTYKKDDAPRIFAAQCASEALGVKVVFVVNLDFFQEKRHDVENNTNYNRDNVWTCYSREYRDKLNAINATNTRAEILKELLNLKKRETVISQLLEE